MKQVISSWNKWVSGALMLSVLLLSTLFTGCQYDDTEITNRLDKLEEKVEKLESDLQTQVDELQKIAALQEAIEALKTATGNKADKTELDKLAGEIAELATSLGTSKTQIEQALTDLQNGILSNKQALEALGLTIHDYTFNEETGKYEVLLSNGTKIELLAKAETATNVVTVKEFEGKNYWAVNDTFLTDADGNKIPVSVVPQVKINPDTKEVEVSVNGEKWHTTGIIIEEAEEVAPALISAISSDDKNLYITLADGTELTVALVKKEIDVKISVKKIYAQYGETKTVKIEMKNVEKYIIVKPEGWRASIADGILTVTAPAEGVGETSGYVQIFTVSADGKSAIYEVKVQIGDPDITITVKDGGLFDITVSDAAMGAYGEEYFGYIYGVVPMDGSVTLEDIYQAYGEYYDPIMAGRPNKNSLKDLSIAMYTGSEELQDGVEYLIWAMCFDSVDVDGYAELKPKAFEEMFYVSYYKPCIMIDVANHTFKDADLTFTAYGMDKVYFYVESFACDNEADLATFVETYTNAFVMTLQEDTSMHDNYQYWFTGNKYENTLTDFYNFVTWDNVKSGQTYLIMTVPADNLTKEAVVYETVTMANPVLGATTADVTISDINETQTKVSAKITPVEGSEYRATIFTESEYALLKTDEDKLTRMMTFGAKDYAASVSKTATPGTKYHLVVFVYDLNGVGKIYTQELVAPDIEYSTATVSYTIDPLKVGVSDAEITVTTTGDVASLRYISLSKSEFDSGYSPWNGNLEDIEKVLAVGTNRDIVKINALNETGVYTIRGLHFMTDQYIFLAGVDKDGKPTKMYNTEPFSTATAFVLGYNSTPSALPKVKDVLYATSSSPENATWTSMKTVNNIETLRGEYGMFKLDIDWNGIEKKNVWVYMSNDFEPILDDAGNVDVEATTQEIMRLRTSIGSDIAYETTNYTLLNGMNYMAGAYMTATVYLVVQDVDGTFYPYQAYNPEDYMPATSGVETWKEGDRLFGWE